MKKLFIIAVASSFIFTSCSKEAPTQPEQPKTQSATQNASIKRGENPGPPAPRLAQKYVITNIETIGGIVPYVISFRNANTGQLESVVLNMGQSITICLLEESNFTTNFAYTIQEIGNC